MSSFHATDTAKPLSGLPVDSLVLLEELLVVMLIYDLVAVPRSLCDLLSFIQSSLSFYTFLPLFITVGSVV
ncbi:hypothetical protein BKA66DRAFT_464765 [Pyrenochaeta sp. MPI-SDFR-AT-0127]|nr:hypothetical protein BKA66DRAFT_464765 [Pyrenochaeta sp. MPI-SDFR-AT-0127]